MGVFKSLERVEAGIDESKQRFMDGLISYSECLRAMASVICREYEDNKEDEELEFV